MLLISKWIGKKTLGLLWSVYGICELSYVSLKESLSWNKQGNRVFFPLFFRQVLFTGVDALPIISLISLLLGTIVITQSTTQLPALGGEDFIGKVIVVVIIRELGPLLTAIVVIGRSCSAISAELGLMRINQEVEALEMMGINMVRFLVLPRIFGCLISILCLTLYFDVMAILGGYIISKIQLVTPFDLYIQRVAQSLQFSDIFISLVKCSLFGITIAVIGVYNGLGVKQYMAEVPQAITKGVISSMVVCFLFNSVITIIFYT